MKKNNFYLILIIIFALPSYLVRFNIGGIPTTLLEILIYISFVFSILYLVFSKKFSIFPFDKLRVKFSLKSRNFQFSIPIILFIIAGIIGVIMSPDKNVALGQFKAYIIDPIIFFWIIVVNFQFSIFNFQSNSNDQNSKFKTIFQALILGGTLVALHAIYQKITGDVTIDGRVVGIFGYSPNYLSMYLTPIAVLAAGYGMLFSSHCERLQKAKQSHIKKDCFVGLPPRNDKKMCWFYYSAFFLMLVALYFSGSRAGLAVTFVSISFLIIIRFWDWIRSQKIVSMFICLYVILLLAGGYFMIKPNFSLNQTEGGRIVSSNNVRWQIWDTSGKMLETNHNWLWGMGLGNYQNYFSDFTHNWVNFNEYISPNALTAHNLYLQTWFNLGLLGLIAFIWLIVLFFRNSLFIIHNSKSLTSYSLLLTSVMFSILLYGIIETTYWKNDMAVMFWFLLGLGFIINKTNLINKSN